MASYLDPVTRVSTEDPFAARMRRDFLESAFDLAATPTPIAKQQIAGFDPLEQQARQAAGGLAQFQPFIQQAAGFFGPQGARDFYNPYEDAVVQQTISDLTERADVQGVRDRADAVRAGAFGGSRGRLMESERERALGRGLAEAIGGIRSRGFEGARAAAQTAGTGLSRLATTGQQGIINQINALTGLGALGRGIQQAGFDATFDAAQRAALEPRQRLQTLQGMLGMLPTTRAETTYKAAAGVSPLAQALSFVRGGGIGGLFGNMSPQMMPAQSNVQTPAANPGAFQVPQNLPFVDPNTIKPMDGVFTVSPQNLAGGLAQFNPFNMPTIQY
tara:strand:- start:751 stop:1743 length:993 start_codon:yes stop_codon:yes gene_type:complete